MRSASVRVRWAWVLVLLGHASSATSPARAQEDATTTELRRAVARLEAENAELRATILEERSRADHERSRAAELERAVEALVAELDAARASRPAGDPGETTAAEPPAPIPSEPFASPASLHAWLVRRYADDIAPLPRRDEAEAGRARDAAEAWCARIGRELRGKGMWVVSLSPAPAVEGEPDAVLVSVLDEKTHRVIGSRFRAVLPPRTFDRVREQWASRKPDEPPATWDAGVMLTGRAAFDPERLTRGVYDTPAFVGPYCGFSFDVEWVSLKLRLAPAPAAPARSPR